MRRFRVYNDNVTIFDEIAKGEADLMMTDALQAALCGVVRMMLRQDARAS
jgi:hypothetical protein